MIARADEHASFRTRDNPCRPGIFTLGTRSDLNSRAKSLLEGLAIPWIPVALVGELKHSEQQLVEIARALAFSAELINHGRAYLAALRYTKQPRLFRTICSTEDARRQRSFTFHIG